MRRGTMQPLALPETLAEQCKHLSFPSDSASYAPAPSLAESSRNNPAPSPRYALPC